MTDRGLPDFAVVVPMANEEELFEQFVALLAAVLDRLGAGKVYFVVDNVSRDRTRALCEAYSRKDGRFLTVWAPENRNVVDAYLRGYREAYDRGHPFIIEMDAGLSHDPASLPAFLERLQKGYDCVLGSRFAAGGSISRPGESPRPSTGNPRGYRHSIDPRRRPALSDNDRA